MSIYGSRSAVVFKIFITLAFATGANLAAQPAGKSKISEDVQPMSAQRAEATANRSKVRIPPRFKLEPDYIRPEEARLRGEFGEVVLSAIVQPDGKVTEPEIKISSRSSLIDAAALAAVPKMMFEPAKDASGNPVSLVTTISLEYSHTDFTGARSFVNYGCNQAVRDYDWWRRTWPSDQQDRLFKTLRGYVAMADLRAGKSGGVNFDTEWSAAIDTCRNNANKRMISLLQPHGPFIRDMLRAR